MITRERFIEAFNTVEKHLEQRYEIPVMISDVLDPNTGDFDGVHIKIDYKLDPEISLIVLVHLFGHTVQWNTNEEFRKLGQDTNLNKTPEELVQIEVYEEEATSYSISLLHECGIHDLDQWASDWWRADWEWLKHLYSTGERADFRRFFRPGEKPPLKPRPIPAFRPQKWVSRWSF